MPQQTKIFRVFVSSTFTDMKEERSILQKQVFPELERLCESKGAKFQAVDLRWGVTEESQLNQKTVQICLNEIDRCQRISPKPNFLILLGDKYGWQPIPEKIPLAEWKQMMPNIIQDNLSILNTWYKKDENALPAEYLLQTRNKEYVDYKNWEIVEKKLQSILRIAVQNTSFSEEQKSKYYCSATHQEILKGALNLELAKVDSHVMAFVRNTANLPKNEEAMGFIDLGDGQQNVYAKNQLDALKSKLKETLKDNCISYEAHWKNGKTEITEKDAFFTSIFEKYKAIIEEQINEEEEYNELNFERDLHKNFMNELVRNFVGRTEILNEIDIYADEDNLKDNKPLSIIGASGSGKSSLMAKSIHNYWTNYGHYVVCYRFLGTSATSSSALGMLQGVCTEIARTFEKDIMEFVEKEQDLEELSSLSIVFQKVLAQACLGRPIIVFFDALDQLSDDMQSIVSFIPEVLPPYVKIVCSALPSFENSLSFCQIKALPLLSANEAKTILSTWLNEINRQLSISQFNYVIDQFEKTSLPIYLKMAFENVKYWTSYQADYNINDSVDGIICDFFSSLENEFPKLFVENTICYLLSGKYQGLNEYELLDILALDPAFWAVFINQSHPEHRNELQEVRKMPISVWSRLYHEIEPFLSERNANGMPILTFFHRQFNEILRKKYAHESQTQNISRATRYHKNLCNFYKRQEHFYDKSGFEANVRKSTEIIFQANNCKDHQTIKELLSDIIFLQAKSLSGLSSEINVDYKSSERLLEDDSIKLIASFFERHYGWIKGNPTILFQQLYNDLQWFDDTKNLAENAKQVFLQRGGQFLQQIIKPKISNEFSYSVLGFGKIIGTSLNKKFLAIYLEKNKEFNIWDTDKEQAIIRIPNISKVVDSKFSENNKYIYTSLEEGIQNEHTSSLWDIENLTEIYKHSAGHSIAAFSDDSKIVFISQALERNSTAYNSVFIDLMNKTEKSSDLMLNHYAGNISISPDNKSISISRNNLSNKSFTCEIWDIYSNKKIKEIEVDDSIRNIEWANNTTVLIKTIKNLYVQHITVNQNKIYENCHAYTLSPNKEKLAINIKKGNIKIYHFPSDTLLGTLANHASSSNLLFNEDASKIISSSNHFLVIWDANDFDSEDGKMILLYNTGEIVTKFSSSEDESKIETEGIKSVKVWDITKEGFFQDTGHELHESKQLFSHQLKNNKITYSKNGVIVIEDRNKKAPRLSFEDTAYDLKQFISPAGIEHFVSFISNTKSTICIWNAETLENHQQNIKQADRQELTERWTISPDGKYFVRIFNTNARYLHLLHIESGETLFCLEISSNSLFEMPKEPFSFSKDGKCLKISIAGGSEQVFDIENKQKSSLSLFSTSGNNSEIEANSELETFIFNPLTGTLNFRSEESGKSKTTSLAYYYNSKLKKCIPLQNQNRFVLLTANNELFALEPKGL